MVSTVLFFFFFSFWFSACGLEHHLLVKSSLFFFCSWRRVEDTSAGKRGLDAAAHETKNKNEEKKVGEKNSRDDFSFSFFVSLLSVYFSLMTSSPLSLLFKRFCLWPYVTTSSARFADLVSVTFRLCVREAKQEHKREGTGTREKKAKLRKRS